VGDLLDIVCVCKRFEAC